jgi:hypothetical protein
MLKAFIATSVSIASILSITGIADAGSINKKSVPQANQTQLHLITRQPQSNVSQADLKGIEKAIAQHFREKNNKSEKDNKEMPLSPTGSRPFCIFWEVTSLRLLSLADNKAKIVAKLHAPHYDTKLISTNPVRWNYEKIGTQRDGEYEHPMLLTKSNGKWKVSSSVV